MSEQPGEVQRRYYHHPDQAETLWRELCQCQKDRDDLQAEAEELRRLVPIAYQPVTLSPEAMKIVERVMDPNDPTGKPRGYRNHPMRVEGETRTECPWQWKTEGTHCPHGWPKVDAMDRCLWCVKRHRDMLRAERDEALAREKETLVLLARWRRRVLSGVGDPRKLMSDTHDLLIKNAPSWPAGVQ